MKLVKATVPSIIFLISGDKIDKGILLRQLIRITLFLYEL